MNDITKYLIGAVLGAIAMFVFQKKINARVAALEAKFAAAEAKAKDAMIAGVKKL